MVIVVPLQSDMSLPNDGPQVSVIILVSTTKFQILYELLREARAGAERSSFLFSTFGIVSLIAPRDDDVIEHLTFDQWMKNDNPLFVTGDLEFGLAAKTEKPPQEPVQKSLQSIHRWLIGLVVLTVLSLILQCAKF